MAISSFFFAAFIVGLGLSGAQLAGGSVFGQGFISGVIGGERGALTGAIGAIAGAIGSTFGPPVDSAYGGNTSGRKDEQSAGK